jgi:hypothetical protein
VFHGPSSEVATAKHGRFSSKLKAYNILCLNAGGPGTTMMAVGSQQRNRIDNAMYELLADWVQEDVKKAAGGDSSDANLTRPHLSLQLPYCIADKQIPEAFTQGFLQRQG